jgi:hypothetical protein
MTTKFSRTSAWHLVLPITWAAAGVAFAQNFALHTFEQRQLTDVYYSEGIAAGDLNNDGHVDVVYGPYWFAGPSFGEKREIFPAQAQNRDRYANHFFAWVYDFSGDGWPDVLTAGFPGTPGYVYENPQAAGHDKPWPKHEILDAVCNESPQFVNLVGDERPELVCSHDGFFGYATWEPSQPFVSWSFRPVSDKIAPVPFGHGLGVGDVNRDGRQDVLMKDGWFEQPADANVPRWPLHRHRFAAPGGAEMYAYDVDGDGDNDVITSLAAHDFGLVWHEQVREGDKIAFREHTIMGEKPENNRYGLVFSEPHSLNLADIDGDGLNDIVTGKTYWSHHRKSPLWDAGAVVYWFRLVRGPDGVDWVPHQADGDSGIGRQVIVHDINRDGLPDIASGGMKGAHVLLHQRQAVGEDAWRSAQPQVKYALVKPYVIAPPAPPRAASPRIEGALEGESLKLAGVTAGSARTQNMANFQSGSWSGGAQLFWSGGKPGDRLELTLTVPRDGLYAIAGALTKARDYGVVQLAFDGHPLGEPIDLYSPTVTATGEQTWVEKKLAAGDHRLTITVIGANEAAAKSYMFGLDYVRLIPR